ncbi:MAG: DUF4399 domain-containing protein [Reichenbachiella sp.]
MKKLSYLLLICLVWACGTSNSNTENTVSTEPVAVEPVTADSAYVFFKNPANGATVPSPVFIEMGVSGMEIEPAGVVKEGFGHHHILINQTSWPEGTVIPASDSTIHFGKGQTDASIELPAGEYTIALQFADGVHSSYGETMATSITVTVE